MSVIQGRMTVENQDSLVVFLIGARVNKWWMLPLSLPILASMPKMLAELQKDPNSGLMGVQSLGFGGMVQYWRSIEDLNRYANDRNKTHQPTWLRYMRKLFKNASTGIWHETYVIHGGEYECVYTNMPRFGLGTFKALVPATGARNTASARLNRPEMGASE